MRKIRQVLRLNQTGKLSIRNIARSLNISRDAVTDYLHRASVANITWPLPDELGDDVLKKRLFPVDGLKGLVRRDAPNFALIHQEMKRADATLVVLHEEYLAHHPDGICYSHFTDGYRTFKKRLNPSMRQTYHAGEFVFVDYAGPTRAIVDISTGNVLYAQIFVGVLGASNYIYAEAHWSQKIPDWIAAHVRMFEHFGGVTAAVGCDNLKSAVTKASRKEPVINGAFQNFADHHDTVIFPARPGKPKDKAKAENGVLIIERWILFRLRKRTFTSLGELNEAIKDLLVDVNNRPFKKLPGTRQSAFETIDYPALRPLPGTPFIYAEFRRVRVSLDYFIELDGYYYSVPSSLNKCEVDVRITANAVEVMYQGKRVASHVRDPNRRTTVNKAHMTEAHRQVGCWSPDQILEWAEQAGEHVYTLTERILKTLRLHKQGYRLNLSLNDMANCYGNDRLNAACRRVMEISEDKISNNSITSLRSILQKGLDIQEIQDAESLEVVIDHGNIRGAHYYR